MKKTLCLILAVLIFIPFIIPASASDLSVTFDFSDAEYGVDTLVKEYNFLHDIFYIEQVGDEPNFAQAKFSNDRTGNKVMNLNGYFAATSYDTYDKYSFSASVQSLGNSGNAVFVRGADPVIRNNPKNAGEGRFSFYEWDWYTENGGKNNKNGGNMGNSGCGIMLRADGKLVVNIKTFETDGLYVGNYPLTFDAGTSRNYYTVKVVDENNVCSIFINDTLICKIEMSSPKVYDGDPVDKTEYYSHAVIKGADGTLLGELDNARLAVNGHIALASRGTEWNVASMTLKTGAKINESADTDSSRITQTEPQTDAQTEVQTQPTEDTSRNITDHTEKTETDYNDGFELIKLIVFSAITIASLIGIAVVLCKRK